jgi:multidrug efflux pump subunit AcrA (membrane-fusion protein)
MSRRRFILAGFLTTTVMTGALLTGSRSDGPHAEQAQAAADVYQCAMHPQIVAHEPGTCPICGMRLDRVEEPASGTPAAAEPTAAPRERKILFYRHPMRPDVSSPVPAKDEMGMNYIPVYAEDAPATGGNVPGRAGFTLSTERQQLIGVTRARVERRPLALELRAAGKVAYDPALYQAIVEYREALKARAQIKHSPWGEAHEGAETIVRAAGLKLRQQGISEAQLDEIGPDPTNLLLPGRSVWVYAQVYEHELPLVHPGQPLEVTDPSVPGRTFSARVTAIDSILNPTTRTARVRALVATPDASLRPETFVHVTIHVPLGEQLAVPAEAVLDSGARQIVFVVRNAGEFEPRAVQLGREAEGYYEVRSGLEAGEEVVTSANFLIDSESRFRAAVAAFAAKSGPTAPPGASPAGTSK